MNYNKKLCEIKKNLSQVTFFVVKVNEYETTNQF